MNSYNSYTSALTLKDYHLANATTGTYLTRSFNIDPPESRMMPGVGKYMDISQRMRCGRDCDEVYPGIIIGTGQTMKDIKYLQKLGVTHVLNVAENDVNVSPNRYFKEGIQYKGIRISDLPQTDFSQYFEECADFIDRALSMRIGLIFVNCLLGYSRAATAVAAYLMIKQRFSASEALQTMRRSREVKPNRGFLGQLGKLDDDLRKQRHRRIILI